MAAGRAAVIKGTVVGLVAGGLGLGVATLAAPPVAQAQITEGFDGAFVAAANANATRFRLTDPDAPLTSDVMDAGGPTAIAALDSTGESRAVSSFPSPGETTAAYPSTARGLTGAPFPPDYPLFVATRFPTTPKAEVGSGPYLLSASSAEDSSHARASYGGGAPSDTAIGTARSEARTERADGQVSASGRTEVFGIRIGPLSIGHYASTAETVVTREGTRRTSSSASVVGSEIAGSAVRITEDGIGSDGSGTSLQPAIDALAAAGMEVFLLPSTRTETGINSAALRVIRTLDSGEQLVVDLGQTAASIDAPESKPAAPPVPAEKASVGPPAASDPPSDEPFAQGSPVTESTSGASGVDARLDEQFAVAPVPAADALRAETTVGLVAESRAELMAGTGVATSPLSGARAALFAPASNGAIWVLFLVASLGATGLVLMGAIRRNGIQ